MTRVRDVPRCAAGGFVWNNPKAFVSACKSLPLSFIGPVDIFALLVGASKIAQLAALCHWAGMSSVSEAVDTFWMLKGVDPNVKTLGVAMFIFGTILMVCTHSTLGKDGLYGAKLGKTVIRARAFPFNTGLQHPQYTAAIFAQLGLVLLLASKATVAAGLVPLALLWATAYVLCMKNEA